MLQAFNRQKELLLSKRYVARNSVADALFRTFCSSFPGKTDFERILLKTTSSNQLLIALSEK